MTQEGRETPGWWEVGWSVSAHGGGVEVRNHVSFTMFWIWKGGLLTRRGNLDSRMEAVGGREKTWGDGDGGAGLGKHWRRGRLKSSRAPLFCGLGHHKG